jgi:hypothetical protein
LPGAQSLHELHETLLTVVLNVPVVQAAHCRSLLAFGLVRTYVPAGQSVQVQHVVALTVVL